MQVNTAVNKMAEQSQIRDEKTQIISILVVPLCTASSFFEIPRITAKYLFTDTHSWARGRRSG